MDQELELICEISAVRLQQTPNLRNQCVDMVCLLLVAQRCSGPWVEHTTEEILCSRRQLMPHYRHTYKLHNVASREFSLGSADCPVIVLTVKNANANAPLGRLLHCITWVYFLSIEAYECTPSLCVRMSIKVEYRILCNDDTVGRKKRRKINCIWRESWCLETMDTLLSLEAMEAALSLY